MAKDRVFPDSQPPVTDGVIGMASPKDRLAAYILDCTLMMPLVQLLQSPVKKWILESFLFDEGADVSAFRIINLFIFVALFVVYYTLAIWWKGQTLGKMFFSIKVVSYHGHLSLTQSFLRAVFIFFELLFLGIPLTSIFSHSLRRPIHDRVADTIVISMKNPSGLPSRRERWAAQWASAALGLTLVSFSLAYILSSSKMSIEDLEAAEVCEEVVKKVDHDLERIYEKHLLGKVSDQCLMDQAREALWKNDNKALAQFSMAAALMKDGFKSKTYLRELCKDNPNHHLCILTLWVMQSPEEKEDSFSDLLEILNEKNPYNFVRSYLAAYANNEKKYLEAEALLKPIEKPGALQNVVSALTFHSLLGQLKWDEAYWVAKTHGEVGDDNILYFMQLELKDGQMSNSQQLQLLDFFYPSLAEKNNRRPASTRKIPNEIRDIYNILEGRQ